MSSPDSSVIRRPFLTALAAVSVLLAATSARAQVQIDWDAEVCGAQYESAITTLSNVPLPNRDPFDLDRAMTLFRFNRQRESRAMLDAAARKVRGAWRWRLPHDLRSEVTQDIDAFRDCVATTKPAPLGTLTVRTRGADVPAMTVSVDAIAIGRTSRNGTITARVPSGVIRVTAERTPSWWGSEYVSIRPGRPATVSIAIDDGKEVSEETPLVLAEAVDDIVPASTTSFTLKFMRAGRLVPIVSIQQIDLDDPDATSIPGLAELFTVSQGAILARNTSALFDALAPDLDRTISLLVVATDSAEVFHANRIAFRVGRSGLSVALAPPPSNPQLALSNIQVGVSVMGAGIAVERVSDARGRIEIASFPHGPIALDCVAVSEGRYYYGEAMLVHSGQRQVKLVLRHVSDVINGVPALSNEGPGGAAHSRAFGEWRRKESDGSRARSAVAWSRRDDLSSVDAHRATGDAHCAPGLRSLHGRTSEHIGIRRLVGAVGTRGSWRATVSRRPERQLAVSLPPTMADGQHDRRSRRPSRHRAPDGRGARTPDAGRDRDQHRRQRIPDYRPRTIGSDRPLKAPIENLPARSGPSSRENRSIANRPPEVPSGVSSRSGHHARHPIRRPLASQRPAGDGHGAGRARPRHRRHHGDLHRGVRRAAAAASLRRP